MVHGNERLTAKVIKELERELRSDAETEIGKVEGKHFQERGNRLERDGILLLSKQKAYRHEVRMTKDFKPILMRIYWRTRPERSEIADVEKVDHRSL